MTDSLLSCRGLTMRFGGLTALDGLDIEVGRGDVLGLVGPNGSGKTTFFNVVTGIYKPYSGRVTFNGVDITGARPQTVYTQGIARTFQRSRLCLELTVFDNIMIGSHKNLNLTFLQNIFRRSQFREEYERGQETAIRLARALNPRLLDKLHSPVADLSMIDRRRVEICRALAGNPLMLFLDEPSAGMTSDETNQLMDEILAMDAGGGKPAIVLIEHEMGVIRRVTSKCVVLNFGRKLCEGTYESVTADPVVQEAYLGRDAA